jgi:transcription antitermination factor NusG
MFSKVNHPKWHVVYTLPRSERKVASHVFDMGIEAYLPLQKEVRQWSDRKRKIEIPLFPNYVFIRIDEVLKSSLYSVREVVKFVSVDKKPVIVKDEVIESIKKVLSGDHGVRSDDYFQKGAYVKIHHGKFAGLEGMILEKRGNSRLLIQIRGIMKAFSFDISAQDVDVLLEHQVA